MMAASIQETGKLEYTQARVGIILKVKDEKTGLIVWTFLLVQRY